MVLLFLAFSLSCFLVFFWGPCHSLRRLLIERERNSPRELPSEPNWKKSEIKKKNGKTCFQSQKDFSTNMKQHYMSKTKSRHKSTQQITVQKNEQAEKTKIKATIKSLTHTHTSSCRELGEYEIYYLWKWHKNNESVRSFWLWELFFSSLLFLPENFFRSI